MKTALIVTGEHLPPRYEQEAAARKWGAGQMWIDDIDDWIDNLRADDEAGIFRLACLAPPARRRSAKRLFAMVPRLDKVLRSCAVLVETATGRRSDDAAQMDDMMAEAHKLRVYAPKPRSPGRPVKHNYTDAELGWMKNIWLSREFKTVADREAAVRQRFPDFHKAVFYRVFGKPADQT